MLQAAGIKIKFIQEEFIYHQNVRFKNGIYTIMKIMFVFGIKGKQYRNFNKIAVVLKVVCGLTKT